MLIVDNPMHTAHRGRHEMHRGKLVPCHETPERLETVRTELLRRGFAPPLALPEPGGLDAALAALHAPRYLDFLRGAWDEWLALDPAHAELDVLPTVWPGRGMRHDVLPQNFAARIGLFAFDAGTPITAGSWRAARAGAAAAIGAARQIASGEARGAFVLTRPPGHHAGPDYFGGYCFLNNAALAAQALRDGGAVRVAVLDVDYHHGNGTQHLFYSRADVLTISIHGDPMTEYPFYCGHADERGEGRGEGFNLNLPLPRGSGFARWREALHAGMDAVQRFGAEALVVPLGVDTFEGDPISGFTLRSDDFLELGRDLATLRLPTLFVFEGGYAVEPIGVNVANVLEGFGR